MFTDKARMTGAQRFVRRQAAVRQAHHLLVATFSDEVDAAGVDHEVAEAADEAAPPDAGPQVRRQRRGVARPIRAESSKNSQHVSKL